MLSNFFQLFAPARGDQVEPLTREIADQCLADVRHRVAETARTMGDAELRGYVRARALRPVRRQVACALAAQDRGSLRSDDLVPRVLERTIHAIVKQYLPQRGASFRAAERVAQKAS